MNTQAEKINEYESAAKYLDKLFEIVPVDAPFNISSLILDNKFAESEKIIVNQLSNIIEHLLRKYKYVNELDKLHFRYTLSEIGIKAKKYGGHTNYQNELLEVEELSKEKLKIDLKNSLKINKSYWWTFRLSILGFLLALGKILFDIYSKSSK